MEIKEEWREIKDFPNYQISNMGRVKSLWFGKEKILKQGKNHKGYCMVKLSKEGEQKTYQVHRIVATTFLPNPQNLPQVNHKNEQKTDNRVENLEWCTIAYNNNYGKHNERVAKARQKPILQFSKSGNIILHKWESTKQASELLNINRGHICECLKGKLKSCGGFKWMYLNDYVNRMEKLYQMILQKAS